MPVRRKSAWTGKHDANGVVFPASEDGTYAWSAAFVSYVMRIAGAGARFPYSASHSDYIDIAKQMKLRPDIGLVDHRRAPEDYAPQPGDLICLGRGSAHDLHYDDLPAGHFPGTLRHRGRYRGTGTDQPWSAAMSMTR